MTKGLAALAPVAIEALLLFLVSRLLFVAVVSSVADRRGKGAWLALLRLPGNLVHEYSHCLGFLLCGYRVQRVVCCIFDRRGRGSCTPGRAWSPIAARWLATGVAALMPLLAGSLILMLAAHLLGILPDPPHISRDRLLAGVWTQAWGTVRTLDWHQWRTYLFLYLALSIGAELSPSTTDLRYGVPALIALAGGLYLFAFAVQRATGLRRLGHLALEGLVRSCTWLSGVLLVALVVTAAAAVLTLLPGVTIRILRRR